MFVSTGTQGGGQESTFLSCMSTYVHHGLIFVPLGYKFAGSLLSNLTEIHGGSAWGAGMFTGADGSRQISELEKDIAVAQGTMFWKTITE